MRSHLRGGRGGRSPETPRLYDTPIHFEGRAEAIILELPHGLAWSAAPDERLRLRSLDGVSSLWLPSAGRTDDAGCGISVANPGSKDIRLVELAVPADSSLSFWPAEDAGLEVQAQAAGLDIRFAGQDAKAAIEWSSAGKHQTVAVADEFVRAASACGGSTLVLSGGVLAFDALKAGQIAFLRRGVEEQQLGRYVSSLLSGKLIFYDAGAEAQSLLARELIWLDLPTGRMTLRAQGESLLVTFDGRVHEVLRGGRSMNPSRLAALRENDQVLLAGWALVAVWGFLWSARQLLLH